MRTLLVSQFSDFFWFVILFLFELKQNNFFFLLKCEIRIYP